MKLRSIRLHPFAGTQDRELPFADGLNVVLGPNEKGKSTLVKGLKALFFLPVELTPHKFGQEAGSYLPRQGGDTIRVSADIDLDADHYHVEKEWGGNKRSRIILPNGFELSGHDEVESQLRQLLRLNQATYEQVLITYQNDLALTISKLEKSNGHAAPLADKMREMLCALDGVPVDALREEIELKVKDYWSNWDKASRAPAKGRGIENPWKREVGHILQAWYDWQVLESQYRHARAYEDELEKLDKRETEVKDRLTELKYWVSSHEAVATDARKRQLLEVQMKAIQVEQRDLEAIVKKWPVLQNAREVNEKLMQEITAEGQEVRKIIDQLQAYINGEATRARLVKVAEAEGKIERQKGLLATLPEIRDEDLEHAKKLLREIEKRKVAIEAQDLYLKIRVKKEASLQIKKGLQPKEEWNLTQGTEQELKAEGQIIVETSEFEFSFSGKTDIAELFAAHDRLEKSLENHLAKLNVPDLDTLSAQHKKYLEEQRRLKELSRELQMILDGRTKAQLQQEISHLSKPDTDYTLPELNRKREELGKKYMEAKIAVNDADNQIGQWQSKGYKDSDEAFNKLLALRFEAEKAERDLQELRPLPEGIADVAAFISQYEEKRKALEHIRDQSLNLERERHNLEKKAPEQSTEELAEQKAEARAHFEREERKGGAYLRIQQELKIILEELNRDTYKPLQEKTAYYLEKLTGGKYKEVKMNEMLPKGLTTDEVELPVNLLSAGTNDLLALATRLAMADLYLEENEGFLILDDPLVNLDPVRQQAASECLREIARKRQVIVLTCHPSHAEELGGDVIEL